MTLEEIYQQYALNDGEVISFQILFASSQREDAGNKTIVVLKARKRLCEQQFESCTITLEFSHATEVNISEDFRTNGGYSDIVFTKLADGHFYLSFDPYGNTGEPNENDNFVITAKQLILIDEDVRQIIS